MLLNCIPGQCLLNCQYTDTVHCFPLTNFQLQKSKSFLECCEASYQGMSLVAVCRDEVACQRACSLQVAQEGSKQGIAPLKIKKVYVLAAHMVRPQCRVTVCACHVSLHVQIESHVAHNRQQHQSKATEVRSSAGSSGSRRRDRELRSALQELLSEDYSTVLDITLLGNPWRTVEAYHFFLTVQRLFYAEKFEESLKTVSVNCPSVLTQQ